MIKDFTDEYARYKAIGQKAMAQTSDDALNRVLGHETNSMAVIVRHISGNFISRFTEFLTSDGEKPWRDRDSEFAAATYNRQEIDAMWAKGWSVLETELAALSDDDLQKTVYIRRQPLTVQQALSRSLAHVAYHVGQIVLLARLLTTTDWQWISIPKGKSQAYNLNPNMEKKPL